MGARAQVKIEDTGVYLYTHWGAETIQDVVKGTIKKGWRLFDPEYFTRILFEAMIDEDNERNTETGFGIGTSMHGDIEKLITVNCEKKLMCIENTYGDTTHVVYSFDEILPTKIEVTSE